MNKIEVPNWDEKDIPPMVIEMVRKDGLLDVLSPLEIIDYGFQNLIADKDATLKYLEMFLVRMKTKSVFYDGSGKTFQEIYDNVLPFINEHPEQQVLSVDAAGQARSVELKNVININGGNAESFGVYDEDRLKYYIRNFIKTGERATFLLIFHEALNEPFTLIRTLVNMYISSIKSNHSSGDAGVMELIHDNLIQILNGDISSLGFDLFAIRKEQFNSN